MAQVATNIAFGENHLLISILSDPKLKPIEWLSKAAARTRANIIKCRMQTFGTQYALNACIQGSWHILAKFEDHLKDFAERYPEQCRVHYYRTETHTNTQVEPMLPYLVEVITLDQPGVLSVLSDFFEDQDVHVHGVKAHTKHDGLGLQSTANISIEIGLPKNIHIATLREDFLAYCEEHNLDASLEPQRYS